MSTLLEISNLTIAYQQQHQWMTAVRDFSLQIETGQTYGLVGESGSGKTTVALAIIRYLSETGKIQSGKILFNGTDLLSLSLKQMRQVWGKQISFVPQNPLSSLNPAMHVGEQVAETLRLHVGMDQTVAQKRTVKLLDMVRVPDPTRVAQSYPHQLSGGMQQRVIIAMALSTAPQLLILDEPTTNLDVTTQAAVLDLFAELIKEQQTSVLYVTHNLGVVARICDRVAVLYAGELVEDTTTIELYNTPYHPYSQGLLNSAPRLGHNKLSSSLQAIPGQIPSIKERPSGCVFAPRCHLVVEQCHEQRPSLDKIDNHMVRCHRWQEIAGNTIPTQNAQTTPIHRPTTSQKPLLQLQEVKVHFDLGRSLIDTLTGQKSTIVKAVDGIDLDIRKGQTIGLVGESGSGKTTLARAIIGLNKRTSGEIDLLGMKLPASLNERDRETLSHLQYIFQNPEEALNPYITIEETLSRPFITLLGQPITEAKKQVGKLLNLVKLPASYATRYPNQLSGGEKQRIAIARAFATNPQFLIADESVSALDVSVQASILNLLDELQVEYNNTLLFISHDLAVIGYLADVIAVIYAGQLMEIASNNDLFAPPYHPYTEALLSAIPVSNPAIKPERIRLEGDVPSQINLPTGCPFHPRCPRFLGKICVEQKPTWQTAKNGARIFCHIPLEELAHTQKRVVPSEV